MAKKTIQIVLLSTCETYYNNSHFRTNYNQLLSLKELEISIAKKKKQTFKLLIVRLLFSSYFCFSQFNSNKNF